MAEPSDNWLLSHALHALVSALEVESDESKRDGLWREADALLERADAEEDAEIAHIEEGA